MPSQATAMFVNDFDTAELGFILSRVDGKDASLSIADRVTQIAKRVGAIPLARDFETKPRQLTVVGTIRTASVTQTLLNIHELKARLFSGITEVRFNDDPTKMYIVKPTDIAIAASDPQFANPVAQVTLTLVCHDPIIYEQLGTVIGFNATAVPCPLGSAVSLPLIHIAGPVTNPVVTYRDFRGVAKKTLGFTAALGGNEWLDIDCGLMTVTRWTDGAATVNNALALLSSGDFLLLDPEDAAPWGASPAWPTLEISPAASCEAFYRRSWL